MFSLSYTGVVEGLYTTPNTDNFITEQKQEMAFTLAGIPGDRHAGQDRPSGGREKKLYPRGTQIRNNRQWSAVSVEEIAKIAKEMDLETVKPEWLGANILISGIPSLSTMPPMALLKFFNGDTEGPVLVIYCQNRPCIYPHRAMEEIMARKIETQFSSAAKETRGLVGWVEKPGTAFRGDRVEVWTRD